MNPKSSGRFDVLKGSIALHRSGEPVPVDRENCTMRSYERPVLPTSSANQSSTDFSSGRRGDCLSTIK